jgi:tetratricopeptide (TPR) repeat protein
MGDVLEKMIPKAAAEADSKRGIEHAKISGGARKPLLVLMLGHLADVYALKGEYEKAENTYSKVLAVTDQAQDVDEGGHSQPLANEAELYIKWKRYPQAMESSTRALKIVDEMGNRSSSPAICKLNRRTRVASRAAQEYEGMRDF